MTESFNSFFSSLIVLAKMSILLPFFKIIFKQTFFFPIFANSRQEVSIIESPVKDVFLD